MQIHRVRGRDLREALERARAQHGDDALVLSRETMADGGVTVAVADSSRGQNSRKLTSSPAETRDPGLVDVERVLRRGGASEGLIARTLEAVQRSLARGPFALDAAAESLGRTVAIAPSPRVQKRGPGVSVQPCILAFVGPTGVGKTTTLAKLASRLVRGGRRVGLVSMDTQRPGAVEQLRALASAMGASVATARDVTELSGAIASFGAPECVLVDTTGRSPRDVHAIASLSSALERSGATLDTYLVLQATASRSALEDAVQGFAAARPSAWVLTKLDETRQPAPALECASEAGASLAFLCDGQEISANFHRAAPERVADLYLRGRLP
ncbi:MAG: hypothetical protein NTV21_07665 [Planctomycetota bacterium]|nr:hypothetical protein [Planctomycetota bacterium]